MTRKELLEKYRGIVKEQNDFLNNIVTERRAANSAYDFKKDESYVARESDIAHLQGLIQAAKESEERAAFGETETRSHEVRSRENRKGIASADDERAHETEEFMKYIRTGDQNMVQVRADMASNGTTTGGYLVPTFVSAQVIQDLAAMETVRAAGAQVITVAGNTNIPIMVDPTAHFIQEANSLTASDPTLARVQITPNLIQANTKMSWQLINRSAADVTSEVTKAFVRSIAKLEASKFLFGSGTNEPQGLCIGGTSPTTTASTSTFTTAELLSLMDSINPIYAANATWIMSPTAQSIARTLESSNGALIWYNNLVDGSAQLYGRPVVIDANMQTVAATHVPVVFADVNSAYVIGEEVNLRVFSDPYTAAPTGEVRLYVYKFVDGKVKVAAAAQFLTMHA